MDRRLLTLSLGMFALGTDSFVFAGILPEIAHSFGVSIGAAGQLISVYALSYALLGPTIAAIAANVPRKRLLLSGIGLFVIANLGTSAAPNLGIALATRAFAGLGAACSRRLPAVRVRHWCRRSVAATRCPSSWRD
jgi:predicted MFS family arabinose efflux permease|nr:MFS transporter [Paraburkholderia sp. LEh10]